MFKSAHLLVTRSMTMAVLLMLFAATLAGCGGTRETQSAGPTTTTVSSVTSAKTTLSSTKSTAGTATAKTTTTSNANTGGLTSTEASNLAWTQAKKTFGDAVLWRLAPVSDRYSTVIKLDSDWRNNDRAAAWFVWYADPIGENWLLITISGKSITHTDIGTRGSVMSMGADWPRQSAKYTMKDAAAAAAKQGANLSAVTWVEFTCDYQSSDYRRKPSWVFGISDTLANGGTLNYRIFVDAITGSVSGAINDRDETMKLPIDVQALQQTHAVNHQADLLQFFSFISKGDQITAVRQLAYQASPNETTAQQWLANFNSIKSLKIVSVEQVNLEQWTATWESYKVTLDITTSEKPEKYGWDNGRNIRWVTIIPQGAGAWKVAELAQNP